jgi:uncharacterized protein (DUF2141 family)
MARAIVFLPRGFALSLLRAKIAVVAALALLSMLSAGRAQPAGKLSITVTGVRNGDGVIRCALFNSPAAFPKIGQEWRGVIAPIRGGAANCVFSGVPAGSYAVAFFHAEHNETQLMTGMFGKPQQGTAFLTTPPAASAHRVSVQRLSATTAATWRCKARSPTEAISLQLNVFRRIVFSVRRLTRY